jgi:UDP-N-acetylglucosamine--N-acetylmuramyl-(pentapeptide) pyrophosphoryl-undecaprenol N-acetylglucosamine transferase
VSVDQARGAERLLAEVGSLFGDPSRLAEMAAASARLAKPDAAWRIAREVLAAAGFSAEAGADW